MFFSGRLVLGMCLTSKCLNKNCEISLRRPRAPREPCAYVKRVCMIYVHVDEPDTFVAHTNVIKHRVPETNVIRKKKKKKKDKQLESIERKDPEAYTTSNKKKKRLKNLLLV